MRGQEMEMPGRPQAAARPQQRLDRCRSVAHGIASSVAIVRDVSVGRARKHRFHFGLQRGGIERLDDVVADAGLFRGNDVFSL
jgi:hypothetical protein